MNPEFRWRKADGDEDIAIPNWDGTEIVLQVRYETDGFTESTPFMSEWQDIKLEGGE